MSRQLVNGSKRSKGYFFTETATDQNRGFLLRNDDIPPEVTFRDLLENLPFFDEEEDQAKLDDVSSELYLKAGLVILSTDAQAISRITKPSTRALAAQPSQLTSAVTVGTQDINTSDNPLTGQTLVSVTRDVAITTRSEYQVGLTPEIIAWLETKFDTLDSAVAANTSAIDTINNTTIPAIEQSITDLETSTTEQFMNSLPVGAEMSWPSDVLPSGDQWLFEDGSTLNEIDYPELFAVIGITFGSGGAGTFRLPDPRGKVNVPKLAADPDFGNINDSGGNRTKTVTTSNLPPHTHEAQGNGATIFIFTSGEHVHNVNVNEQKSSPGFNIGSTNSADSPTVEGG